jgi:hypothetical protein
MRFESMGEKITLGTRIFSPLHPRAYPIDWRLHGNSADFAPFFIPEGAV